MHNTSPPLHGREDEDDNMHQSEEEQLSYLSKADGTSPSTWELGGLLTSDYWKRKLLAERSEAGFSEGVAWIPCPSLCCTSLP